MTRLPSAGAPGRATVASRVGSLRRAAGRLAGPLHLDLGGDHRDAVFVAGSGRSGTSWVAESVERCGGYRYVFEPFHPGKVPAARPFGYRRYLRPDDRRPSLLEPARRVLSGEVRGLWTDRFNRSLVARRRLIKDIRANLFAGWLAANFPEMPVVFVLRHPGAVAHSRTRLGWRSRLEEFLAQPELVEDFLVPIAAEMRAARTEFERHVFACCIETRVPLAQLGGGRAYPVLYERLCERPEELRGLHGYLGLDEEGSAAALRRPSALSRPGSALLCGGSPVSGWREEVGGGQLRRAEEILALFGLDRVYDDSPVPDADAARRLLGEPWLPA